MNIFDLPEIANHYDEYYLTEFGKEVDRQEKSLVKEFLEQVPVKQILELGCGTGHWTQFFSELGYTITAVDISDAMLAIAHNKKIKNAVFRKADVLNLPFSANQFEFIVSITMLEFVDDINKAFNEIYRILKPEGWLLLGSLNVNSALGITKNNNDTFRNAHFFSKEELIKRLSFFGTPQLKETVYLDEHFNFNPQTNLEGAFIVSLVQKTK